MSPVTHEVNTVGLEPHSARPAASMPIVRGRCPACNLTSLFLASGGFVTCASLSCPDPSSAYDVLNKLTETEDQPGHQRCEQSRSGRHSWGRTRPGETTFRCKLCGVERP